MPRFVCWFGRRECKYKIAACFINVPQLHTRTRESHTHDLKISHLRVAVLRHEAFVERACALNDFVDILLGRQDGAAEVQRAR